MRNTLGVALDKIWAELAGDNSEIPTGIENGFTSDYSVNQAPDRRNMNDILAKTSAVCFDVNKYGASLPWSSDITYGLYATVFGTDGTLYVCQLEHDDKDPTVIGNRPTYWKSLAQVLWEQEQEGRVDTAINANNSSTLSLGLFSNNTEYLNTSTKKLMIVAYGNSTNDSFLQGFIGVSSATTRVVNVASISEGSSNAATSATFIVPPNWYWKALCSGNSLSSYRIEAWEI